MKKRTEILLITLVLTGSAIAAALTSDYGIGQAHAEEAPTPAADSAAAVTTVDASEASRTPVVYDMDIPADVMSDYETDSPQTADSQPTEDQVANDRTTEQDSPIA